MTLLICRVPRLIWVLIHDCFFVTGQESLLPLFRVNVGWPVAKVIEHNLVGCEVAVSRSDLDVALGEVACGTLVEALNFAR